MGKLFDPLMKLWWYDLTNQFTDEEAKAEKLRHARALDSPTTEYISNGFEWLLVTGTAPTLKTITATVGDNSSIIIKDSGGNTFANGDTVVVGAVLTVEAVADTGYDISTFTIDGVDKKAKNPETVTISANMVVVSAATESPT